MTSKVKFLAISKNQNEKIIEGKKHKPPGKITFLKSGWRKGSVFKCHSNLHGSNKNLRTKISIFRLSRFGIAPKFTKIWWKVSLTWGAFNLQTSIWRKMANSNSRSEGTAGDRKLIKSYINLRLMFHLLGTNHFSTIPIKAKLWNPKNRQFYAVTKWRKSKNNLISRLTCKSILLYEGFGPCNRKGNLGFLLKT